MILQSLFLTLLLVYAFRMLRYWWAWRQIPCVGPSESSETEFFSIIIPVRNEATSILILLQDLENQSYLKNKFEVLVVDDHSDDGTPELVEQFRRTSSLNLKLLFLASFPEKRQKKAAIETGIFHAQGPWIACTDGDCRLSSKWLWSLNQVRQRQNPKMVSGPVVLSPSKGIFEDLQALELSALIGVGAASIQLGQATMCNGANLAYEKEAFLAVNGFAGNEQIASGDDEFLLHKIERAFPGKVAFVKEAGAIVQTAPMKRISQFVQQRVRWASKWKYYESGASRFLAVLVLGANVAVFWAFAAALFQVWSWSAFFLFLVLKLLPDFLLLKSVLGFFQKKRLLSLIGLLQLVYLPYVLLTAIWGLKGNYHWKGRKFTTP